MERRCAAQPPRLPAGLVYRFGGEVDSHQPGTGAASDLKAVAPAAAGEIQHGGITGEVKRSGDLGYPLPGERAVRKQAGRQAQVTLVDLILDR